jgi:SAM-dependent methyltransferase
MDFDKKQFYRRGDVVRNYEAWRFGSPGGAYVDVVEKNQVLGFLAGLGSDARVLDLPCGQGRLLRRLEDEGFRDLVGADASPAMLELARGASTRARVVQTDAMGVPFPDDTFDAVCSLRFLFHVRDAVAFFSEVRRVLRREGRFVFDTLRWSPRGLVPPVDRALGGALFCRSDEEVASDLRRAGFEVVAMKRVFLLPSLAYRFLPALLVPAMAWTERVVPDAVFSKTFVHARKAHRP